MTTDRDALRERLWRLFLDELDEHGRRLERGLDEVANALPAVPEGTVAELFRSAHSLKGAAQAVGAAAVGTLCHELEEVLANLRDGSLRADEDLLGSLGAAVDMIVAAGSRMRSGDELADDEVRPVVERLAADRSASERSPVAGTGTRPDSRLRPAPSPAPAPVTASPVAVPAEGGTVRMAAPKLDALLALAGELITVAYRSEDLVAELASVSERLTDDEHAWRRDRTVLRSRLARATEEPAVEALLAGIDERTRDAAGDLERLARAGAGSGRALRALADAFAEAARRARTVPFTDATAGLARVVSDLCRQSGKQGRLTVESADVEIDRALVATLNDVLRHLVRNAVDHGLEGRGERLSSGKPDVGQVAISAVLGSDAIEVTVSDDGRGVDLDAVATAAGSLAAAHADSREARLVEALFRPGLSTAAEVGPVSGRGVGLDVVRTEVEAVGGSVTLHSQRGAGTQVVVTVPFTLSTMRALLVRVAGELVALPSSAVRTLSLVDLRELVQLDGGEAALLDGVAMRLVRLQQVLGWSAPGGSVPRDTQPALVVAAAEGPVLLAVDELVEEREVVVRAATARLAGVPGLLGTALLEDGTLALVMSPSACARLGLAAPQPPRQLPQEDPVRARRVLLVEDTLTTRELERSILEDAGYSVLVAHDGAEAWQLLQDQSVDVVVSDVNMPRMDGIALCRAIRSASRSVDLPVVLVTSLARPDDRRRGLEAGADAYLTKSGFGREELLEALERLL